MEARKRTAGYQAFICRNLDILRPCYLLLYASDLYGSSGRGEGHLRGKDIASGRKLTLIVVGLFDLSKVGGRWIGPVIE